VNQTVTSALSQREREKSQRAVTIRDVALRAGVALSTVSQVLNGRSGWASAETSERILAAARALNYRPNAIARGLVLARTGTLGVVITSINHPYCHRLVEGIEQVVSDAGYSFILACAEDHERERTSLEMLSDKRVDGIIFMGNTSVAPSTHVASVAARGIPVVVVNRPITDLAVHHITWDDCLVGRMATQHLIDLGHRRIAHVGGALGQSSRLSALWRQQGYLATMERAGLRVDDGLVLEAGYSYEHAFAATNRLLALSERPTAIFAASDSMAIAVINALTRARVAVPEDVSVIGVNDDLHARLTEPPLTTIRLPIVEAGRKAARIILDCVGDSPPKPCHETLPSSLVVRASTSAYTGS
jgi:LacI family transcriptional regulator